MSIAKSEGLPSSMIASSASGFNASGKNLPLKSSLQKDSSGTLGGMMKEARNSGYQVPFSKLRSTVTSLGETSFKSGNLGADGTKYTPSSELEPLLNPEMEWKMFLADIKSDNWSRQFEACNALRKVCKFH
mmetsp:Transcript_13921/g.10040  ORF Transcript_13921/g.10040 Transcript_13921/m.10040 type:complete len:131 (+) Transcript_13921:206-598(+)|eukprot:CAMPEP_0202969240 /NCGR_PEP_ID=MMETSP1396-20130829/14890_1 /ASSEMBLY_ACC=CAM_ASM_000872 /TAXON_ID= /ORGANISM="Pseudokeronopsis sp., Strain Brazil" /LENGTH=130 /DNA_ID=CAMNT_0049696543 /DNA_START=349 /DNA_END=741 /DNA_ORIENTATION=+